MKPSPTNQTPAVPAVPSLAESAAAKAAPPQTRPGNGYGDVNHEHTGPPGGSASDTSAGHPGNGNGNGSGNGNGNGNGNGKGK